MSDNTINFDELSPEMKEEYRSDLEQQAKLLGVTFQPNIGTDKLYLRVKAAREGKNPDELKDEGLDVDSVVETSKDKKINYVAPEDIKLSPKVARAKKREYLNTKVRVQVTCNDPAKQSWQGEFFEVSNSFSGEKREFIPFNTPWHVNRFILNMLEEKTFTHHYRVKTPKGEVNRHKLAKAFNITVLPPLTEQERQAILNRQLASKDLDSEQAVY